MLFNLNQLGIFTDMMKEGFIYVDKDFRIKLYNKRAKEIFGIDKSMGIGHPAGSIKNGDIVIIGDNCLGKDDGSLIPESLRKIGIWDNNIQSKDLFMGVGLLRMTVYNLYINITIKMRALKSSSH
ncbi:hypothetical protein [Aminipila terrae]|uniref:PAS domain-containing protein n=1 Tax=Aminipila terrae TaxID=2697030 RepID=A0A6P1MIG2_9FIRM|nr:hypothetical protein [Aminipila terrae]QHI72404.1 hypothetical protein Ami3637_08335 [Aminipila terrae]